MDNKKTCYIIGAAPISVFELNYLKKAAQNNDAFIIAADGGIFACAKALVKPDLCIGDFDSTLEYTNETKDEAVKELVSCWLLEVEKETHPKMKDETDLYLAYMAGKKRGFLKFVLLGVYFGRPDHAFANMQMLCNTAKRKDEVILISDGWRMQAVHNGTLKISDIKKGAYVSVFSQSDTAKGVTLKGLVYELTDGELKNDFALGVSNESLGENITISVKEGTLLIMCQLI